MTTDEIKEIQELAAEFGGTMPGGQAHAQYMIVELLAEMLLRAGKETK